VLFSQAISRMNRKSIRSIALTFIFLIAGGIHGQGIDVKQTETYHRIKASLDATPAIDTHDHLQPFALIAGRVQTERGSGMTLYSLWQSSYYTWFNPLSAWPKSARFDDWWLKAKHDFDNARATSFYRYQLPAFTDLYGIDFDTITDDQARTLNTQIFDHYKDRRWIDDVLTNRANIELIVMDPFWNRLGFDVEYPFAVPTINVTTFIRGIHPSDFANTNDSLYVFAAREGLRIDSLNDYVDVIGKVMAFGKSKGAVCLKTTTAYERTLDFANMSKDRAEKAWGRPREQSSAEEIKDFQDYVMWRIVELCAKLDLPFQIHTGHARIQGSNPMLLVDLIAANPKTKFILFHGGYPWIGETGAIATRNKNVWIDSVWLPTISYTMGKRAYQEWLEVMPSNRIMWGADAHHAEGIYAATEFTRRCLAEALAEKVERGELREEHALRIGRQIMRENALEIFPSLKSKLWRSN
jgi:predicted TIM-barrel fold metal-dependent hydrolase